MIGAGIHPDDILIVDKSLTAKNNDIIIAVVNSELTVKRLHKTPTTLSLLPENPLYSPIEITQDTQFSIWGIVTSVIHQFR
jgi:DNA polymerase V